MGRGDARPVVVAAALAFALVAGQGFGADSTGWTDDRIVELARSTSRTSLLQEPAIHDAILNPVFPEGGRPDRFFTAVSAYFDDNGDGRFTREELDRTVDAYAARYADLLRESLDQGPSQELATEFRVKTWKLLQKLVLFRSTLRERNLAEWHYAPSLPPAKDAAWDKEHTLAGAADFRQRVCEASAKTPVVVKFGSTQCADCMLMEHTQGVRIAAAKAKNAFALYKLWWGPNLPEENDRLRKAEGIKSSPTFAVYREGRRFPCGFAFLDEAGEGLESCLEAATAAPISSAPECGAGMP
jgi:hypothetical protein